MFSTRANRAWFEFTSRERHLGTQSRLQHVEVDAHVFAVGGGVLVGAGRGEAEGLASEIDEADPIEGRWKEVFLGIKRSPLRGDVVTSQWASLYPQKNFFPPSLDRVGFIDLAGKTFRLSSSSAYKNAATDGKDVGVDFDVLKAALRAEV